MQEQIYKRKVSPQPSKEKEQAIAKKFEEVKNTPVQQDKPSTRVVRLMYKSCCGCGCTEYWYERTVAVDSPLRDGSRIDGPLRTDRRIR